MLALLATCLLAGCVTPSADPRCPDDPVAKASRTRMSFHRFNPMPKARIGSIPCPGPLTFFETADPSRLGTHEYGESVGVSGETSRGIVYTLRGGFIDIAHTRKAADWTAYHHPRIKLALTEGWRCVVLPSKEGSVYYLRFNYPGSWQTMPEAKRRQVIDELSIRLAQRLAITQTAWHEIATWFGYSSTMYPEKPSALTYDDMTSHVLGANVAGMALRNGNQDFNHAMTYFLKRELDRLGPVSPAQTMKALKMVEGKWWRNGFVIKRQLDLGEDDGSIAPWIVPGYPDGGTAAGIPFRIPSLTSVEGIDFSRFEEVEIDPRLRAWYLMRRVLPGNPDRCLPATHFPLFMRYIRQHERGN